VDIIIITDALSRNREGEITEGANSRDAISRKRQGNVARWTYDSNNATAERYEQPPLPAVDNLTSHAVTDSAISDALLDSGHGDSYSDKMNCSPSERKDRPWYLKAPRERPSAMEVRKFFQKVEEEEREMIQKYHTENSS